MKTLKQNLPIILLILAELVIGVLLFIRPEEFTQAIFVALGIVLMLIGIVNLVRFFVDKKQTGMWNWLTLVGAVLALVLGAIPTFAPKFVMGLFAALAVFYGLFLIVAGFYKGGTYFELRKLSLPVSALLLVSAILSVILGIIIVLHPFSTTVVLWRFTGVSLIVEAVGDAVALILAARRK